jgi:hypothetical protein
METGIAIVFVILYLIFRYLIGPALGLGSGSQDDYKPYDRDTFDDNRQVENHHRAENHNHASVHRSHFSNNDKSQSNQNDNAGRHGSDHESRQRSR